MKRSCRPIAAILLLLAAHATGTPTSARRIEKSWESTMNKWALEHRTAVTPEQQAKALAERPDSTPFARDMWKVIGPSLDQDWTLEPAAWFLRITPGLLSSNEDGSTRPTFAKEAEKIRRAVNTYHLNSPKLTPMCMALVSTRNPGSHVILEKIQADNPDKKVQGVAALAAAMALKTIGDNPELMRKRLTYLRKAIIQSSDVVIDGRSVAERAEDELYIIRFLSKGRVAPDLKGTDTAGRFLSLSSFKGKVILLMFWSSNMQQSDRVLEITAETVRKLQGRPAVVIGVNNDTLLKLREMEAAPGSKVSWRNFSDPSNKLAREYRVGSWPLVYILDGDLKIHYAGSPGSFAELTVEALLSEK